MLYPGMFAGVTVNKTGKGGRRTLCQVGLPLSFLANNIPRELTMEIQKTEGVFYRTKSGDGYVAVKTEDGTENIPVAVSYNSDVYDGDTVSISVSFSQGTRRFDKTDKLGKIIKVVKRAKTTVIGECLLISNKLYLLPDGYIPFRIPIKHGKGILKCREGDKIEAEINKYKAVSAMRAIPVRILGKAGTYDANFKAAVSDTPHFSKFSANAERQSQGTKPVEAKNYVSKHTDLRSKPVFTFTDSVFESSGLGFSVSREEGGFKVGIHIADVAEYLPVDSDLDKEASLRGRSILNSRNGSAMLPKSFVNSVCSFNEKREFLAVSVFIEYDEMGNATDTEFCESVISPVLDASAADVDELISGGDSSALIPLRRKYSTAAEQIICMYELAALLRAKRIENGGVDFDLCERMFGFDSGHRIKTMSLKFKSDSALMVNEIFISAGRAVAEKLFYSGAGCVYAGSREMKYDYITGCPEDRFYLNETEYYKEGYTRKEAIVSRGTFFEKHCFETISVECDTPVLSFSPLFHYIYGVDKYTEFFFPAEKYSHLTNLRAIKAYINDKDFDVRKAAEGVSNEEKAGKALKALTRIMTIDFLKENSDKVFDATVIKASPDGVRVLLDCGVAGTVTLNTESGFSAGDRVKVRLKEGDYVTGRAVFAFTE